jgi:hypothetical protein
LAHGRECLVGAQPGAAPAAAEVVKLDVAANLRELLPGNWLTSM